VLRRLSQAVAFRLLLLPPVLAQIPDPARFNRTFTHRTATVNDVRLQYVTGGSGDPIVSLSEDTRQLESVTRM